jgi:hypothetical protein
MRRRAVLRLAGALIAALAASAPSAAAADLWTETGRSLTSVNYWQGITFDAATRTFHFDGPAQGLWRTDAQLTRLAGRSTGIPSTVTSAEGWNHLGDLTRPILSASANSRRFTHSQTSPIAVRWGITIS